MYERYPISGIKQSYRHTRETRTVVMPLLILLVLSGLIFFFVQTRPDEGREQGNIVSLPRAESESGTTSSPSDPASALSPTETASSLAPAPETASPSESEVVARGESDAPAPTDASAADSPSFTPWMSPTALDTYIRAKNAGFSESFWDRGHWITAVEGRWHEGAHEFRIAIADIPHPEKWQWQYRINQTEPDFSRTALEFEKRGFVLVNKQSFDHPDKTKKIQAVWHRELKHPGVAETVGDTF